MTIPKYDEIQIPILKFLCNSNEVKLKDFEAPLARVFNLSDEQIIREYESKKGKIFYDRISWALTYLNVAGLVERPKKGVYKISDEGAAIDLNKEIIDALTKKKFAERNRDKAIGSTHSPGESTELTPQELLIKSY